MSIYVYRYVYCVVINSDMIINAIRTMRHEFELGNTIRRKEEKKRSLARLPNTGVKTEGNSLVPAHKTETSFCQQPTHASVLLFSQQFGGAGSRVPTLAK